MATPRTLNVTAPGTFVMDTDFMQSPFNAQWFVEVPGGVTASYTVNFTGDDLNGAATPTWTADSVAGSAQTATKNNAYNAPIRGLQFVFTAVSGGAARVNLLQGMSAR